MRDAGRHLWTSDPALRPKVGEATVDTDVQSRHTGRSASPGARAWTAPLAPTDDNPGSDRAHHR
jgi:hypothetical protein